MRLSMAASSFLCFLMLFQGEGPQRAHAQQEQQTAKVEEKAPDTHRKESVKWQTIDDIRLLKVWELNGADVYPQVAILRVSDEIYEKFSRDPSKLFQFVNKNKVFSKPVKTAGPWVTLSSVEQESDPPEWTLTIIHGHLSGMIVSALPDIQTNKKEHPRP
jgi:hypothetical protein